MKGQVQHPQETPSAVSFAWHLALRLLLRVCALRLVPTGSRTLALALALWVWQIPNRQLLTARRTLEVPLKLCQLLFRGDVPHLALRRRCLLNVATRGCLAGRWTVSNKVFVCVFLALPVAECECIADLLVTNYAMQNLALYSSS